MFDIKGVPTESALAIAKEERPTFLLLSDL